MNDHDGRAGVRGRSRACSSGYSILVLASVTKFFTGTGKLTWHYAGTSSTPIRTSNIAFRRRSRSASSATVSNTSSARSSCPPKKWWRCVTASAARASASFIPAMSSCRWTWTSRPGTWCATCPRCSASSVARPTNRRPSPRKKPTRSCVASKKAWTSRVRRCCSSPAKWCESPTARSTTSTAWSRA